MKTFLFSFVLIILTSSCSNRAVYDAIHERERQECLKQGRTDCPRVRATISIKVSVMKKSSMIILGMLNNNNWLKIQISLINGI